MRDKSIKVNADGSVQISNVDGLTYRNTGRNIRDIIDVERYMRENGARRIEIDKKAIEHLRMV